MYSTLMAFLFSAGAVTLAVAVGNFIAKFSSVETWIQGIAALSFNFFGLWTIRGDKLEGGENRKARFGGVKYESYNLQ